MTPSDSVGHTVGMAFWTYILRCADGRFYTGHTDDLERRVARHHAGGSRDFTSRRGPVSLVWCEAFGTRLEALEVERRVGGWSLAKKEAPIAGDWQAISRLARPPRERFSTALETNGGGDGTDSRIPFVSSAAENHGPGAAA